MSVGNLIRVLIVDAHPVVRAGLAAILARESDMTVAGEAANGDAAIDLFFRMGPDVVVIDPHLEGPNGGGPMLRIRESDPGARFLAMSDQAGDEDIHRALRAGARGYLMKDAEPGEILSAIRNVRAGLRHIPPCIAKALECRVQHEPLTAREIEVLESIARGFSNKEIAVQINVSESTIKARVKEVLAKLGVNDRTAAVTVALRRGIIHL
ncbi:MAG TPA: response regulator transcription factor [Bryobacteraceae bacterium]|jgi:DNA-binding NarL/FixJ family response regulator|nr:response regulator transcription factor [Bryobacteraceae bacterium]